MVELLGRVDPPEGSQQDLRLALLDQGFTAWLIDTQPRRSSLARWRLGQRVHILDPESSINEFDLVMITA